MLYFKEIPLLPSTYWWLDVIVCDDEQQKIDYMVERYGWHKSYYQDDGDNYVTMIKPEGESIVNEDRIVLVLKDLKNKAVMVHELTHILLYAQKYIGLKVNWESQEWCACFMERIWSELCKPNYEKIKPKTAKK